MSMIKCPNCKKEISDRAEKCPRCGYNMGTEGGQGNETEEKRFCSECGTEVEKDAVICQNCGCPLEDEQSGETAFTETTKAAEKGNKRHKKLIIIIVAAILAIAAAVAAVMIVRHQKQIELETYAENFDNVIYTMLNSAVDAEESGNLIMSVWRNAIYENRDTVTDKYTRPNGRFVDDFNDALSNLFSDSDFSNSISGLENNQSNVQYYMKMLQNPPEEYEEAYAALKELYDAYINLTNHVIQCNGSLNSFTDTFNTYISEFLKCFDNVSLYVE